MSLTIPVPLALLKYGNWNGITSQAYLVHIHMVQDIVRNGAIGIIKQERKNVQMVFVRPDFGKKKF